MEVDPVNPLMNNTCYNQSSETTMINSFSEELAATLGEDFHYLFSAESNTNSPQWDIDSILVGPVTPPTINSTENHCCNNNNDINDDDKGKQIKKKENQISNTKQGAKRKRQPSQVQDHILAERKRRELLSQLFISLSALVPGLKKVIWFSYIFFPIILFSFPLGKGNENFILIFCVLTQTKYNFMF